MPLVSIDARDAAGAQLRGWGLYARELADVPRGRAAEDGSRSTASRPGGPGPELLFEQFGLPRHLRRIGADLVHRPTASSRCAAPARAS